MKQYEMTVRVRIKETEVDGVPSQKKDLDPPGPGGGQDPKGNAIGCEATSGDESSEEEGEGAPSGPPGSPSGEPFDLRVRKRRPDQQTIKTKHPGEAEVQLLDNPGPGGGQDSKGNAIDVDAAREDEGDERADPKVPSPSGGSDSLGSPKNIRVTG